jgi:hypothetical protein
MIHSSSSRFRYQEKNMSRPTNEQLKTWCFASATSDSGTCEANSAQLKEMTWGSLEKPIAKRMIKVYIDRGYAQNHWAFAAKWEGDDAETVIDNTIGQFNRVKMVFIGSIDQWIAELREFLRTDKVTLDPDGRLYTAAFDKEVEEEERKAAYTLELERQSATVSKEAHIAATLQKNSPKKSDKTGCCVIL